MTEQPFLAYATTRITQPDVAAGLRSGKHPLDDYFARHALENDQSGISRAYVLRNSQSDDVALPAVLGFYTLSMALVASDSVKPVLAKQLPKYPMPVALIGRLAVDERAQGRRLGERLLMDALRRVVDAAEHIGCVGVIVDAKDESAEQFYCKYDFATIEAEKWPHRMFLPLATAKTAFE